MSPFFPFTLTSLRPVVVIPVSFDSYHSLTLRTNVNTGLFYHVPNLMRGFFIDSISNWMSGKHFCFDHFITFCPTDSWETFGVNYGLFRRHGTQCEVGVHQTIDEKCASGSLFAFSLRESPGAIRWRYLLAFNSLQIISVELIVYLIVFNYHLDRIKHHPRPHHGALWSRTHFLEERRSKAALPHHGSRQSTSHSTEQEDQNAGGRVTRAILYHNEHK